MTNLQQEENQRKELRKISLPRRRNGRRNFAFVPAQRAASAILKPASPGSGRSPERPGTGLDVVYLTSAADSKKLPTPPGGSGHFCSLPTLQPTFKSAKDMNNLKIHI